MVAVDNINDLLELSFEDMVKKIPDPPQVKKDFMRIVRAPSMQKRLSKLTTETDSDVSYAQQKMNIFCTKPELEPEPRKLASSMLLSLSPEKALENLQKIYRSYSSNYSGSTTARKASFTKFMKKKSSSATISSKAPVIEVSTYKIDFGLHEGTLSPLHENMTSEIVVSLKAGKGRYFWYLPDPDPAYSLTVTPTTGTFKKKGEHKFVVTINFNSGIFVKEMLTLEIPGVGRYFFLVSLESEFSVFGEDIRQYYVKGKGTEIPPALLSMKEYFDSHDALETPGIFITNGKEDEILVIRDKLNRGNFHDCHDIHSLAKTFIAWFDELSPKLFQSVSENLLLSASGQQEYLSIIETLREPQSSIAIWLLEVLADVSLAKDKNNVDIERLSDILSPALYTPQSADYTKNSHLPGAVSKMIRILIDYRIKLR